MKNTLPLPNAPTLAFKDSQIAAIADEISQKAINVKLGIVFLGHSSDLDKLECTKLPSCLSEYWFCHSLSDLFRLNLHARCDLFVVIDQIDQSSIENLQKLLSQRKGEKAHVIQIKKSHLQSDLLHRLLSDLLEDVPRKLCMEKYLDQAFAAKNNQLRSSGKISSSSKPEGINYRENLRQALWDKLSQSPELFLQEEIKRIRN